MNKSTLLGLLFAGLLLLNICLSVLLYRHKPPPHPPGPNGDQDRTGEILIEKLHLDKEQANTFTGLRAEHMLLNESINRDIRSVYDQLYDLLQDNEMDELKKTQLFKRIEDLTSALNDSNFEHFKSLKSILREDQLSYFNAFTYDLRRRFDPVEPRSPIGRFL